MDCQISHAGTRTTLRRAVLAACSLPLLSFTGSVFATDDVNPSFDIRSRLDTREMRVEAPAGVGNNLAAVFREQQASRTSLAATASARGFRTQGDDVLTDVVLKAYSSDLARRIEAAGGIVRSISERHLRASVLVSSESEAAAIGALPEVRWVAADYGVHRNVGSVTSRAVDALDVTPIAGAPNNLDGTGQTIGIISDSFARTSDVVDGDTTTDGSAISGSGNSSPVTLRNSTPQDSNDLPDTVELRRDDATGTLIDEGAGMAELVHDLAPGADIAFYTAFVSFSEFAAGIDDLCTSSGSGGAGATVVVDDIIYFAELMYQPDVVTQAAADCVSSGVPYFSSAGNNGDSAFRLNYTDVDTSDNNDSGAPTATDGDFHDWDTGAGADSTMGITLDDGEGITVVLQWNQPALSVPDNTSNGPQIDLDAYLFDSGGSVIAGSALDQKAGDSADGMDPVEIILSYANTSGSQETVFLGIDHFAGSRSTIPQDAGTDLEFRLVFYETGTPTYEYTPDGPAMYGHALASGAVSVAAVPWWEAPSFDPAGQGATVNIDPESFTSRGGTIPFHFEADGSFAASTVEEPDLAAVDGNNNTFFGQTTGLPSVDGEPDSFPNFFGTSAAAPNAAAVAALLLEYSDGVTPADLQAVLETTATDVTGDRASAGDDDVTGAGLIDADDTNGALAEFPEADAGSDATVQAGSTGVVLDGSGSTDNNGVTAYNWSEVSSSGVTINNSNMQSASFDAPSSRVTLEFELSVSDADGLTHADQVTVQVDEAPSADAGPDQTVSTNSAVTLDASASTDDGGTITYAWTQTGGAAVTLDDDTAEQPSFTAPGSDSTLTFEVEVTDTNGFTGTDTVVVTVLDNPGSDPVADAGSDITVETDSVVELDGTDSSDADAPIAAYDWTQTDGTAVTLNGAMTSTPGFTAPSSTGTLEFRLQVTDSDGFTDSDTVTVTVEAASSDSGGGSGGGGGGGGSFGWLLLGLLGAGARRRLRIT